MDSTTNTQPGTVSRACLKIAWGPAARDFGGGQGGEVEHPAAGCDSRANAGHRQKIRRPEGFRGKGPLASLFLGHRALAAMLPRHASPSGLFRENRTPWNFQTGS